MLKATKQDIGKRLDVFLKENFSEISRARIKNEIKKENVKVTSKSGKKLQKASYILKEGDVIQFSPKNTEEISLEPDNSIKFKIVYENEDAVVINKPAGLVVHPSQTTKKGTLVNGLLAHFPKIKNVGDSLTGGLRPGIVHRLDKDASGLMVVAKNQKAFEHLKKQFKDRKVVKKYIALVAGNVEREEGVLTSYIARSKSRPDCQIVIDEKDLRNLRKAKNAKPAETRFKVLERFNNFTLCEVRPRTGRTHQIRVHFTHLGHPLVGDIKYGFKKKMWGKKSSEFELNRFFLHSSFLEFKLPSGEKVSFSSKLPKELADLIKKLQN